MADYSGRFEKWFRSIQMMEMDGVLAIQTQQLALMAPVGEVHNTVVYQQAGHALEGTFKVILSVIRWGMILAVLLGAGFLAWGFVMFNRAADNPQMMSKSKNQMMYAFIGAVGAVMAFFLVSQVIDLARNSFRGEIAEVGQFGSIESAFLEERLENDFLGMYNDSVVLCQGGESRNAPDRIGLADVGDTAVQKLGWIWQPGNNPRCIKRH